MSRIYFHGLHHTSELLGSERANMDIVTCDIAMSVVSDDFPRHRHRLANLLPSDVDDYVRQEFDVDLQSDQYGPQLGSLRVQEAVRRYIRSLTRGNQLVFNGQTHHTKNLIANTVVATRSPVLALMAKLHWYCEGHLWVPEEHREWLADVIADGRLTGILRPQMGWESVIDHLINGDGGPVVTSYSVCDSFPHDSTWMDAAWPEEMVASGKYDYNALTTEQQHAVDRRQEEWEELPDDEQWRLGLADVERKWWLKLTPDTLTVPTFAGTTSLWDAVASPEWNS